jgi:hypothetical protein
MHERRARVWSVRWYLLFGTVLVGIAALDYVTGSEVSVWGLYLLPVGVASWMRGFRAGLWLAVLACVLILVAGLLGGHRFSEVGWLLLAIVNRFFALVAVAWLSSILYRKQMLEATLRSYEECLDYLHASPPRAKEPGGAEQGAADRGGARPAP